MPHLGSSVEVVTNGLDKGKTKNLLNDQHIFTPQHYLVNKKDLDIKYFVDRLGYPLFVKPTSEGGHIGISDDSIIYEKVNLGNAVNWILDNNN